MLIDAQRIKEGPVTIYSTDLVEDHHRLPVDPKLVVDSVHQGLHLGARGRVVVAALAHLGEGGRGGGREWLLVNLTVLSICEVVSR